MTGLGTELAHLFRRELDRFAREIEAYDDESALWSTMGAQRNAPGTLAIHVVGGLLTFIGAGLGGTGYVRDRDREFSERDLSRSEILRRLRDCREIVVPVLERLDDAAFAQPYPGALPPQMAGATTRTFLLHLLWHTGWHCGQVYYHRLGVADTMSGAG
jgi:hypothetical protein